MSNLEDSSNLKLRNQTKADHLKGCAQCRGRLLCLGSDFVYNLPTATDFGVVTFEKIAGEYALNRHLITVFAYVFLAVASMKSAAVEVLSAKELASHCVAIPDDADGVDGQYCIRYIQGFIDGAAATDVRVMLNMEARDNKKETYAERAIRIRMVDRSSQLRAAYFAEYCLGDPVPLAEVVAKVVTDLVTGDKAKNSSASARDVVYESLRTHYPCEK